MSTTSFFVLFHSAPCHGVRILHVKTIDLTAAHIDRYLVSSDLWCPITGQTSSTLSILPYFSCDNQDFLKAHRSNTILPT